MAAHYFVISWLTAVERRISSWWQWELLQGGSHSAWGCSLRYQQGSVPFRGHPVLPLGSAGTHLTLQDLAEIQKWQYYIEWLMTICMRFYCCSYWIRPLLLGVPMLAEDMWVGTDLLGKSASDEYSSLSSCTQWEFYTKNLDLSTPRFINIKVPALTDQGSQRNGNTWLIDCCP